MYPIPVRPAEQAACNTYELQSAAQVLIADTDIRLRIRYGHRLRGVIAKQDKLAPTQQK